MTLQPWLLFLHILGATVWIGTGAALALVGLRVRRSSERIVLTEFANLLRYLGMRALMPAVAVVTTTGLVMVFDGSGWSITQPWILIGLSLFFAAFLIGWLYQGRIAIALQQVVADPACAVAEVAELIRRWLIGYGAVLLILVIVVWVMVFRPFS